MITYKLQMNTNSEIHSVAKYINGVFRMSIPFVDDNTDYQEYLKWVAEGNEPEPTDEELA